MTEHKFTDEEIIREFETLIRCANFVDSDYVTSPFEAVYLRNAIDLINRQKAEIEELRHKCELAVAEREANVKGFTEVIVTAKSEAVKEFAEGLKTYYRNLDKSAGALIEYTIDQKLKEHLESE